MELICRLCLAQGGTFYPLFRLEEVETSTVPLPMQVTMCTALMISKNDKLPKRICIKCHNFIREWYAFRRKSRLADKTLRAQLSKPKGKEGPGLVGRDDKWTDHESEGTTEDALLSQDSNSCPAALTRVDHCMNSSELENRLDVEGSSGLRNRHKCQKCPDSFVFPEDLTRHMKIVHGVQTQLRCKKKSLSIDIGKRPQWRCCGQTFPAKISFCHHIRKFHPGQKPFSCDECGKKGFISEETLRRHKMLHSGRYACDVCGKTFTCHASLRIHVRDKHENDRPFVCDVCGKAYVTELLLSYHQRFHTGEKKYVCEVCGVAVVTSSSLAKHKRIHSQVKPHICAICNKGFIVRARLIEHIRVHTGERPFACDLCGKAFTMHDKLKRHKRIHTDHKPFCCDICGNAYSTNHGLSVHLKTHSARHQVRQQALFVSA